MGLEDRGVVMIKDPENGTDEALDKCRELGKNM